MGFLDELYKEAILQHAKHPKNRGRLDPADVRREGLNPSCGDELELSLNVRDGVVTDVRFTGEGCAISQSSASMMTEAIRGRPVAEVLELSGRFRGMIRGEEPHPDLGELQVLQGVRKLHARVKCATLAWVTLEQALEELAGERPAGATVEDAGG